MQEQTGWLLGRVRLAFGKAVLLIPDDRLDFQPTPENMSVRQLAHHTNQVLLMVTRGTDKGELAREDLAASAHELAAYGTRVKEYVRDTVSRFTKAEIDRPVRYFFGCATSSCKAMRGAAEEVLHHCGQMMLYLRLVGITPPNLRDAG